MDNKTANESVKDSVVNAYMGMMVQAALNDIDKLIAETARKGGHHAFIDRAGSYNSLWHSLFHPDTFWEDAESGEELHFPVSSYQATIKLRLRDGGYHVEWARDSEYILIEW